MKEDRIQRLKSRLKPKRVTGVKFSLLCWHPDYRYLVMNDVGYTIETVEKPGHALLGLVRKNGWKMIDRETGHKVWL